MNNSTTYKDSPLGKIPSDWEVKRIGEICPVFKSGVSLTSSDIYENGDYPVYGGNGLRGYTTSFTHEGEFILIGRQGALCGNITFVSGRNYITEHAIAVQMNLDNEIRYWAFSLEHMNLNRHSESSAQPGLSVEKLIRKKVSVPPLPEQARIAEVLGTWDKAITNLQATITQKELRNKWLMQQLLTGKKRLKGVSGEWKEVRMKDLFKRIDKVNDGDDKHSVMTISAKQGLISQEDKFDRVIAGDSLKKYTLLNKNDFAYNKGNSKTYQMGCIYQLEEIESALVPFVYICFSPTEKVYSAFYKHWFFAHGLDKQLNRIITSGARGDGLLNVNSDDFFKLKIPHPTIDEQTAIANVLQTASNEVQLLQKQLDKLREQKKGLMQVLLTGKKRLKI